MEIQFRSGYADQNFLNPADFPWLNNLEAEWLAIQEEMLRLVSPTDWLGVGQDKPTPGWEVIPLCYEYHWYHSFTNVSLPNFERKHVFPQLVETERIIKGLVHAPRAVGFFKLLRGSRIVRHTEDPSLRIHLGLVIPQMCGIAVNDEVRTWEEGKLLIPRIDLPHEVWNDSAFDRIILTLDYEIPQNIRL